ncbi:MAG: CoA transferase [Acidimicrobiaceae bacterium]|nr:CoA transferase [Acidimicrobiaceae bacterium]
MPGPLAGVRVVEVATHVFVPMSGAVLGDWGAEVIKVEHPEGGDPYRGLVTAGLHKLHHGVDVHFQTTNRGKRSVAVDLRHPDGRRLLSQLIGACDVFVTNLRPEARRRLRIEVDDVRADNPQAIYVSGSAFGPAGPEADRGGYDSGAYWARTGMQMIFTAPDAEWPASPRPAFGDVVGGLTIAGAISTALFQRAMTGAAAVVEVSLLSAGMWQVQMDLLSATISEEQATRPRPSRHQMPNPLMLPYRTADGRFINLQLLSPDRFWPDLCRVLGEPDMANDPRFADIDARRHNNQACITWLDGVFARRPLSEWKTVLADFSGEWVPSVLPHELASDPQVTANNYVTHIEMDGFSMPVVAPPVQFDRTPPQPQRAPEHGEHTESVLIELGYTWDELAVLKDNKVIL